MALAPVTIGFMQLGIYQNRQDDFRTYVEWVRDHLRAKLDSGDTGNDFKVSDIFTWSAYSSTEGSAFIVEYRDGAGVPTGKQVMFAYTWQGSQALTYPYDIFASRNQTTFGSYFDRVGSTQASYFGGDENLCILVNKEGGTRRLRMTVSGVSGTPMVGQAFSDGTKSFIVRVVNSATDFTVEMVGGGAAPVAAEVYTNTDGAAAGFTVSSITWRSFWDIGWDDYDALSFSGGDHSAPAVSPYSAIASFMPFSGTGATFRNYQGLTTYGSNNLYQMQHMIFDNDEKVFAFYGSMGPAPILRDFILSGDIMVNQDGSTDYIFGCYSALITADLAARGVYIFGQILETQYVVHSPGDVAKWSVDTTTNADEGNAQDNAGNWPEKVIQAWNTNELGKWINPKYARIQGPNRKHFNLRTERGSGNYGIKMLETLVTMWAPDFVPWVPDHTAGEFPPKSTW